jgi:hypothetical protein
VGRMQRLLPLVAACAFLSACAGSKGKAAPQPTPTEDTYLSHRGQVMPLRAALAGIAFRPFIPAREIVETALLPPYNGGDDTRKNRGIGFEYLSRREAYVLSQWPGTGLPGPQSLGSIHGCELTAYPIAGGATGKHGALWSNGRIASDLVPAGNADDHDTFEEARRLIRRGACK